jgi:transcriptional regulator of acetoin/glycerol metabolism
MSIIAEPLPQLRFEIIEAAHILRLSRATLYQRIRAGQNAALRNREKRSA